MSLKVGIFEDDQDVANVIAEMMADKDFKVTSYYNFKDARWLNSDIVLGDYRNKIVAFDQLKKQCEENGIPLIAISGLEMPYQPSLVKPFTAEDLQSTILQTMIKDENERPRRRKSSWLTKFFNKTG